MKRKLTALLSLLVLSSVFSACGDNTPAVVPDVTTAAATTAAATLAPSEYTPPDVDYDGREFCLAASVTDNIAWQASRYCDAGATEENGDPINDALYQRNRAVEETLGVKIVVRGLSVTNRNISDLLKRQVLAGEDDIDAGYVNGSGLPTMLAAGDLVQNLAEVTTLDLTHSWWDQASVDKLRILDACYAVTGDISLLTAFSPVSYFVNKAMLADYSLDDPYELVRGGAWTLDKTVEMAEAVSRDVNGDDKRGIEDAYGMCCQAATINYMLGACGVSITAHDESFVPALVYDTPKTAGLIEKLVPFLRDRNLVTLTLDYTGYKNVYTEVFIPMFADNRVLFYNNQLLVALNLRDMDADFGVLPAPKYDEAQENYIGMTAGSWVDFIMLPATNADPDTTGVVLEALGYYGQQSVTPAYIETTVLNKTLRDGDSAEMLEIILASRTYDLAYYYNWGKLYTLATDLATQNSTDFASAYAAAEPVAKAALDATIAAVRDAK